MDSSGTTCLILSLLKYMFIKVVNYKYIYKKFKLIQNTVFEQVKVTIEKIKKNIKKGFVIL